MADYNRVHCKVVCCTANSIDVCDKGFSTVRSTPYLSAVFWKYTSLWSPFHSSASFLVRNCFCSHVYHHTIHFIGLLGIIDVVPS